MKWFALSLLSFVVFAFIDVAITGIALKRMRTEKTLSHHKKKVNIFLSSLLIFLVMIILMENTYHVIDIKNKYLSYAHRGVAAGVLSCILMMRFYFTGEKHSRFHRYLSKPVKYGGVFLVLTGALLLFA